MGSIVKHEQLRMHREIYAPLRLWGWNVRHQAKTSRIYDTVIGVDTHLHINAGAEYDYASEKSAYQKDIIETCWKYCPQLQLWCFTGQTLHEDSTTLLGDLMTTSSTIECLHLRGCGIDDSVKAYLKE